MNTSVTKPRLLAKLSHATVALGGRELIRNVELSLHAGEIITLIGPNGGGKTTLVRALLGLLPMRQDQVFRVPGLRIGYMPQRFVVPETIPISVCRFLALSGRFPHPRIRMTLQAVGAEDLENQQLHRLSGGELQRVLLARALLRRPELLVLDEPAQGVDVTGQAQLYSLITRLRDEQGFGVLMVSHDLHLVMASADSVICLNQHVCCTGHPKSVSQHPEFLRLFSRTASREFAMYTHAHDHDHDVHGDIVPLKQDSQRSFTSADIT